MTANVLEHRRAKAFAEALEAHRTGQPASRAGVGELLETAEALTTLAAPRLDREVRAVQRAQLMAAFEQAVAGGEVPTVPHQRRHRAERVATRRRWGRRFAIGGLVAGVTVGSFAGVAAASTNSLPGDALYPMKRGLEGLRLDLADSPTERGALLLDQASARLAEARGLVGRSQGGASALSPATVARLGSALRDMRAEATRGRDLLRAVYQANGSLDPMRKLAAFTEGQDGHWADLQGELPPQLTPTAGQVDQLFGDLNQEVAPLHLDPRHGHGGAWHPAAPPADQGSGASPSSQGGPAEDSQTTPGATTGGRSAGGVQTPDGSGAWTGQGGGAPAAGTGGPVGGLVNGLTGNLTGKGAGATSTPPPGASQGGPATAPGARPGAGVPAAGASSGGGAPQVDPGLDLPPLIPGLLPGLGLNPGN